MLVTGVQQGDIIIPIIMDLKKNFFYIYLFASLFQSKVQRFTMHRQWSEVLECSVISGTVPTVLIEHGVSLPSLKRQYPRLCSSAAHSFLFAAQDRENLILLITILLHEEIYKLALFFKRLQILTILIQIFLKSHLIFSLFLQFSLN